MRQFVTQGGWFTGQMDERFHFADRRLEGVAEGAKVLRDCQIDEAGNIKTRPVLENIGGTSTLWIGTDDDSYYFEFPTPEGDFTIAYYVSSRGVIAFEDKIKVIDNTTGELVAGASATITGVTSSSAVAARPHFVRYGNTALIVTQGAPPVRVRYTAGSPPTFTVTAQSVYREATGTSITLTNGSAVVTGTDTLFSAEYSAADIFRVLGQDLEVSSVGSNTSITLTANWTGPTITIARPPAMLWCENDFGSITEFSARGAALFQQRLWFINTYSKSLFDSSIELNPLRVIASSLYDPFVLVGNIGTEGQLNEASPINADLRIGKDQELMWIVGGDSLMIGGKTQEYALANDRQGIGASSLPQFRVCSYYGSEPGTAVAEFDGNIVFTPEGGGDLISMAYTDAGNKFQARPLNPFCRDITGSTVAFAAAPASQGRPARMVAVQSDGSAVIGYANSKYSIPGWSPITLPGGTTAVDAVRFGGELYLVLRRATDAHTLCRLTDWSYALDLYELATTAGTPGQDSSSWTVDDFEKRSNTLFAVGEQTFYTMLMSADTDVYDIGEVVSRTTWNGKVYGKWSVGNSHYLLVSEATGAPTNGWTITGADSGAALSLTSFVTSTETKALEFVDLNGTGEFTTSIKLTRCWVGFPVIPVMEPINIDGQDELGPSRGRKRRVMSARVRYKDTRQMYVDGIPVVEGAMTAATTELPARSGVFRKTFLGGWRETDVFQIRGTVPYNMYVQDITYEVVT